MMRILLTNDDGIHAEGLAVLERIAKTISDDVWVVAPETDQSGFAHSLSLSEPLRMRKVGDKHFAVRGTPTDCVIMAVRKIMPEPPDLILSGVNSGSNLADDVTYSGTVAGAMEGTLLGIRSIAVSQAYKVVEEGRDTPWETAETLAPELLNGVYGGTKAFVLAFSQSLQHELGDKGVRVQAVLPGATATDFWNVAGTPVLDASGAYENGVFTRGVKQ
jgi:5'-nucleotidase